MRRRWAGRRCCLRAPKAFRMKPKSFATRSCRLIFVGARIGAGPEQLTKRDRDYFAQRTQPSAVQAFLRKLVRLYDPALTVGFIVCSVGTCLVRRVVGFQAFLFTATPFVYLVPYMVTLSSVDRYAFPVYPFVLASPLVVGVAVGRSSFGTAGTSSSPRATHACPQSESHHDRADANATRLGAQVVPRMRLS